MLSMYQCSCSYHVCMPMNMFIYFNKIIKLNVTYNYEKRKCVYGMWDVINIGKLP
jgi:hypothetical protein